jgi:hypothetical protein
MSALAVRIDVFGPIPFRLHAAVGAFAALIRLVVLRLELTSPDLRVAGRALTARRRPLRHTLGNPQFDRARRTYRGVLDEMGLP